MTEDTDDPDLSLKQATELEESIAAQSRIVEDLKAKGEDTTAQEFLEVLLKCRDDLRAYPRSQDS
jgi:hypothetical protein